MTGKALDNVADDGTAAAQLAAGVERVKEAVAEAVEEGRHAARGAIKRSRRAAEGLVDDTEYELRHHVLSSLAIFLGVGLGLGAAIGILLARNRHSGA